MTLPSPGLTATPPLAAGSSAASSPKTAPVPIVRKAHRKSRAGCKSCKSRHVKCDEIRPSCGNCQRRQITCNYGATPTIFQSPSSVLSVDSKDLAISDIELTFHWTTSSHLSLSACPASQAQWQTRLSDTGLNNPHVLHSIFAFTALHLAFCRPERRNDYTMMADYHQKRALELVTCEVANIGPGNCDAVFLSVQLICIIGWARGPQEGEYLAFASAGRSDSLTMLRGVMATLRSCAPENFTKTLAPALRQKCRPPTPQNNTIQYEQQFLELRQHVEYISSPAQLDDNLGAIDILSNIFRNRYEGIDSEYHVVFGWLLRVSDDFLEQLQERQPIALMIYAHFSVLMHEMERFWYMKGWTHHILKGIWDNLWVEHRAWIKWPMAVVGWIPP